MTLRTRLLVNAAVTMICFAAVIGFTIVNMMKIQASNEDEVDALLNVQEAKADLNTLKESITDYSYTLADAQKEDVRSYMKSSSDKLAALEKTMTDDADKAAYDKLAKNTNRGRRRRTLLLIRKARLKRQGRRPASTVF